MKELWCPCFTERNANVAGKTVILCWYLGANDPPLEQERYWLGVGTGKEILPCRFARRVMLPRMAYRESGQVDGCLVAEEDCQPLTVLVSRKPVVEVIRRHEPRTPRGAYEKAVVLCF